MPGKRHFDHIVVGDLLDNVTRMQDHQDHQDHQDEQDDQDHQDHQDEQDEHQLIAAGAGICGSWATLQLARRGAHVLLLEQVDRRSQ